MRGTIRLLVSLLPVVGCKSTVLLTDKDIPPPIRFVLLDRQGTNLLTSPATPLRVSFLNAAGEKMYLGSECAGGGCTMIRRAPRTGKAPKYAFYYHSLGMAQLSVQASRTFLLELENHVDTLRCHVPLPSATTSRTSNPATKLLFNDKLVAADPDQLPIYPLRRR